MWCWADNTIGAAGAASLAEALPGPIQLQQLDLGGEQHLLWDVLYGWLCVFEREGDGGREMIQEKCDVGRLRGRDGAAIRQ